MINLSTPFAVKDHCFPDYCRGIKRLDWSKKDIFYTVIDNSNDTAFGKKIDAFAANVGFGGYKRYVFDRPQFTIENTEDYAKVSSHVHQVYRSLQDRLPNNKFTFNVEDDVEIPPDALQKLMHIFATYPNVGTAVGKCNSRRLKDRLLSVPVAWKFRETRVMPFGTVEDISVIRFTDPPPFGIQIIGASHIGCWLTPTKLIKQIRFDELHGLGSNDIAWGYKLMKAGYHFVIDWSIETKHWWYQDGVKGYY